MPHHVLKSSPLCVLYLAEEARCKPKVAPNLLFRRLVCSGRTFLKPDLWCPSMHILQVGIVICRRINMPSSGKEDQVDIEDAIAWRNSHGRAYDRGTDDLF